MLCKHIQVADDRKSLVTSEAERQFESSGAVNWSQVSQAVGLGMRKCLELSLYDIGKASWHYDPDSFSQSMVDCMTGFIADHYPILTPVTYRAVSNFMRVDMDDCIRIYGMLRGKFKWTETDYQRAAALRAQGLTFKEVAQHLSPTLTHSSVCSALQFYLSPKLVREPISADKLEEIMVGYMQTGESKPSMVYFSKLLGTKSSKQCCRNVDLFRSKGVLPRLTKAR
ncbi:hypothetical protein GGI17_006662 [Coemansia sp. S146]|nr:hypothetical protein GGI17_006662 [Coemansia sp. S146]